MTTLSVLLCNYNHGRYVGRALKALVEQTRPPTEIVVVDDASTDDSVAVIESWASRSPLIRFLRNKENLGWHGASERALAVASGDYLYSGAADDYILPDFLESVWGMLEEHPQAGVGCAEIIAVTPDGTEIRRDGYQHVHERCYLTPADYLRLALESEPPTHSLSGATILRSDLLRKTGGWRKDLGSWADTFAIRAIGLQTGMCYVPQPGLVWTVLPDGLSQTTQKDPMRALKILRRAAALMRSAEFRSVFPPRHVDRWEAAGLNSIVLQPLQPAMEAYQTIQRVSRQTAEKAVWPWRWPLNLTRKLMTAGYLLSHQLQARTLRHRLLREERRQTTMPPDPRGPAQ